MKRPNDEDDPDMVNSSCGGTYLATNNLEYASQCGGEYLESINKTDIADLSFDEWHKFLEVVIEASKIADPPPF